MALPCFLATKSGSPGGDQGSIASLTATLITFGTEVYDTGSYYDTGTSTWTPPAGYVRIAARASLSGTTASTTMWVAIYKDGNTLSKFVCQSGTWIAACRVDDYADGNNAYTVYCYGTTAGTITVSGDAKYTEFSGIRFSS